MKLLDCTLRDGGYYNSWNFEPELIAEYLQAMDSIEIDYIEIGLRTLKNNGGFKGGCAFSTDNFISSLSIPEGLKSKIGVMINATELIPNEGTDLLKFQNDVLRKLFKDKQDSPVSLVRIACHVHEFVKALPASIWLKEKGYIVGFNIMQIADRTDDEIIALSKEAQNYPLDVLYFADSMGGLNPESTSKIIKAIKKGWTGPLGVHTHDNMGQAIANSMQSINDGVTWVDSMGRGPGNAQTEYIVIATESLRNKKANITKLLEVIRKYFEPLKNEFKWGKNPYYYLSGKFGIHPTYIQQMLSDNRYKEEDVLAVIEHLKVEGGKKFNVDNLEAARHFYLGEPRGKWDPNSDINGKEVLILGTGPGVAEHKAAIEKYIERAKPFVIALNTQSNIKNELINIRAACHPMRLLADCQEHLKLSQPLATPYSMLPSDIQQELQNKNILDFGLYIKPGTFIFNNNYCHVPTSLVMAYALAIATCGNASRILLAGFDGYGYSDARNYETDEVFRLYKKSEGSKAFYSITPSQYNIPGISVYGLIN